MHRLMSVAQMREADARAIAGGTAGRVLMERAGAAVAQAAARHLGAGRRVLVLCGPGNNGGDGFVAARLLAQGSVDVRLALLGAREALRGDAAAAAAGWSGEILDAAAIDSPQADLVVDALFGTGLSRDLDGDAAALVSRVNGWGVPVLAVDIPSGVDGDTGAVRGVAVRADETVTFALRKTGHLLLPGRALCGRVSLADIGISPEIIDAIGPAAFADEPPLWRALFPVPTCDAHKYSRGHALVLSGPAHRTGAARLVARSALRAGAGAVTLASPPDALPINAAHLTAIMLRPLDGPRGLRAILEEGRVDVAALGPALGLGATSAALVEEAAAAGLPLVLDADALTAFEARALELAGLIGADEPRAVLTPHAGEFRRLFAAAPDVLDATSKLEQARRAARLLRSMVVLKGADSVIAAPDGRAAISASGTPYLATAGSGDVLAGIIAGLIAQGMPAFEAACAGVWLHGEAGARFGPGLIAEDLPEMLPAVLRTLTAWEPPGALA